MKCPICEKRFSPPVRRGRNPRFCSDKCRKKHNVAYRKQYDSMGYVKAARRKREMEKYWRKKAEEERL